MKKIAFIVLAALIIAIVIPNITRFTENRLYTPESPIKDGIILGLIGLPGIVGGPVSIWYRLSVGFDDVSKVQVPLGVRILDLFIWISIISIAVILHKKKML